MAATAVDTFADNYGSTLSASAASGATTITPVSAVGAPTANPTLNPPTVFRVVISSANWPTSGTRESITVTDSRTGTWTLAGPLINSYVSGDSVIHGITAATMSNFLPDNTLDVLDGQRLWLPARAFGTTGGATFVAPQAGSNAVRFPKGTTNASRAVTDFELSSSWTNIKVTIVWSPLDGTAGSVAWAVEVANGVAGNTLATGSQSAAVLSVSPAIAQRTKKEVISPNNVAGGGVAGWVSGQDWWQLGLVRIDNNATAGDSYGNGADFKGLWIERL